jgi:hypothetical protein
MLREIAAGLLLGLLLFCLSQVFVACAGLPLVVQCKLDALKVLPEDENMITVGDALDVYRRVRACHHLEADGGP